ncbi:ABC transporter substrate-binding protein [uncultured Alsobacter sp.]|uniref:ABC transporter substrate-binding protein n=1 Tax=uncultured Alsobacter sp. TaxID=1748258 RepID=UPI0025EA9EE9|nr:ABC transporter substrate-binding protein [uncultured Alsobacter sp.]
MTTLTIALEKVAFLPPTRVTDDTSVLTLKNLVLEPLLRWDRGFARPALLASWSATDGGRVWTFKVREGARFHDGRPFVAGDAVAFVDAIRESVDTFGMKWSYARYLRDAVVSAPDDSTLVVTNPEPFADILDIFCEFYPCRLTEADEPLLGTGPYRVTAYAPNARAELARLSGAGPERIVALCEPKAEARLAMLRGGGADAALNLERVEGPLAFSPDIAWSRSANTLSVMFYLNCSQGVFRSAEARLAANLAVDKDRLIRDVFDGLAIPAATIVSPFHLGMGRARVAPIPHDPDRARALLDRAGGPGTLTLRTPTHMPERSPAISAFVAESLANVGFTVQTDLVLDRPDYARQIGAKRIGDLAIFDSSPQSTFRVLDDKITSRHKAVWWQGYDDARAEALIATANAAVPDADRERAYARCLERLNEDPPWLYLLHPVEVLGMRPGLGGLSIDCKGTLVIGG